MTTADVQRTLFACTRCGTPTDTRDGHSAVVPSEGGEVEHWFCSRCCRTQWLWANGHRDLVERVEGDG